LGNVVLGQIKSGLHKLSSTQPVKVARGMPRSQIRFCVLFNLSCPPL
jgi:hypothetical protein